jgi:cytochrome P450
MVETDGRSQSSADFDPFAQAHRENPFAFFSWAREHAPVTYVSALGAWMISRYDDVTRVLNDVAGFSSQNALTMLDRDNPPEVLEILSKTVPIAPIIVHYDPPDHAPHRMLWRRLFRGTRVSALKPRMERLAEELVDASPATDTPISRGSSPGRTSCCRCVRWSGFRMATTSESRQETGPSSRSWCPT